MAAQKNEIKPLWHPTSEWESQELNIDWMIAKHQQFSTLILNKQQTLLLSDGYYHNAAWSEE